MKNYKPLIFMLLFSIIVGLPACYYDNEEVLYGTTTAQCDTAPIQYSVQVTSILKKNCYACHATGSNLGNLLLDSYSSARSATTNGSLLGSVNHKSGYSAMPQGAPKLSSCDIQALQTWLDNGTPNN
jgi:mono/diheme cytochrome c family protein